MQRAAREQVEFGGMTAGPSPASVGSDFDAYGFVTNGFTPASSVMPGMTEGTFATTWSSGVVGSPKRPAHTQCQAGGAVKKVKVKQEQIEDPWAGELPPQQHELEGVTQLRQMGFGHVEAIRNLRKSAGDLEMAMVAMISERESAEETRQSDELRLASELNKEEEEERRKASKAQAEKEALEKGDIKGCGLFRNSILLAENCQLTTVATQQLQQTSVDKSTIQNDKSEMSLTERLAFREAQKASSTNTDKTRAAVRLLNLERKAIGWYSKWAKAYMQGVAVRLKTNPGGIDATLLTKEADTLEAGIAKMPSRPGALPDIFAQPAAMLEKNATPALNNESDDDCVEIVEVETVRCGKEVPLEVITLDTDDDEPPQ